MIASYSVPDEYRDFVAEEGRLRSVVQYVYDGQ